MNDPVPNPPPLPPQNLDYEARSAPANNGTGQLTVLRFFIGLIAGGLVSAIIWIGGWNVLTHYNGGFMLFVVPTVKLAFGITLCCIRGWRSMGAGILVSIALGFMIFFGACAAHLNLGGL